MVFQKTLWFMYLLTLTTSFNFLEEELLKHQHFPTQTISKLIQETNRSTVHFIYSKSEIIENFLSSHGLQVTVQIEDFEKISISEKLKIGATLVQLVNYNEFEKFYNIIQPEKFLYDGYFIILFENGLIEEIEKIFSKMWKIYIYNVNVLVTKEVSVAMFTFMPFSDGLCNNTNAIQINEFDKISMQWTTNVFFPKKFKKLNGCSIRAGCYETKPTFMIKKTSNNSKTFYGFNVDVFNILGSILKFTSNFTEYESIKGSIYKNKTATGLFKRVLTNEVDVMICGDSLQQLRVEFLSASGMLYNDQLVIIMPPPFLIDSLRKIFLPFTFTSWISIGAIVLVACYIILTLKFTPRIFHNYVIGKNLKGSLLNVWNVLLGGTQVKLPKTNFPRYLLAYFLVFSLVVRSLYQGVLFHFLKNDVKTVDLKTIDDLIERKFTFYIYESLAPRLEGTKFMERHMVISNSESRSYELMTLNPSFKGVVFKYMTLVLYENFINRNNFTLKICKEVLHSNKIVFYFTKNFYLVDEINDLISNFKSAGLINFLISKYIDKNFGHAKIEKKPPLELNYDELKGIFELIFFGWGCCFVTFACEIVFRFIEERNINKIKLFEIKE